MANSGKLQGRALANVTYGAAKTGFCNTHSSDLFRVLAVASTTHVGNFNSQDLANTAWAFATVDHASPALFDVQFAHRCEAEICDDTHLAQMHQWFLWRAEQGLPSLVSSLFIQRCHDTFVKSPTSPSCFQHEVGAALASLGILCKQEVATAQGYTIDLVVERKGKTIGIEVDGPRHFVMQTPNGNTQLKRRQLLALGNWQLISIPFWEWDELVGSEKRQREYLVHTLDGL
eukprot:CAMPEP_0119299846 /NCGR_PEP_ID=MMETSP1333-20130426/1875_1 /TAXON_ID=418940 /ORGANISM="Scyphosphaera apsteinii, Strain RCC1455" /LENGTH=230 /DNA_ID=CAMNT_0007301417 /DNA_START=511 /DNA_END=1203 /DNA_ORIENTATION=+